MTLFKKLLFSLFTLGLAGQSLAQDGAEFSFGGFKNTYEVTITNITKGQIFTPILATTHTGRIALFELGEAASEALATVAESGDISKLSAALSASNQVADVQSVGGLIGPGESATVEVSAPYRVRKLSLVGMLIPTNDAFVAIRSVNLPPIKRRRTFFARSYDAGSENNDELCDSIPGPPPCFGEGVSAEDGEGFVHIHSGIHGVGDLEPSEKDWNDPVAKVTVRWTGFTR